MVIKLGLVKSNESIKILSKGEYNIKLNITAHQFSTSAKKLIEANGGSIIKLEQ